MINLSNDYAIRAFRDAVAKARSYPRGSDARKSFLRSVRSLQAMRSSNGKHGPITIYPDFCPYSFCWETHGLFGGFIFHKSVQEWSVHT